MVALLVLGLTLVLAVEVTFILVLGKYAVPGSPEPIGPFATLLRLRGG
jgi:hypothetical protein